MFEPDDAGIRSWPPEAQPFVRALTPDGIRYGRAARWKGPDVLVDFPGTKADPYDNHSSWVDRDLLERVPGMLPECATLRSGYDSQDVLWEPDRCDWPRRG
ncbi:hypothetical protein [Zhihengliuella flava]|uniref:Uncharacterized protein n=1 Tax=Zhihengliuella flava TaxID=1285193 RepID=A0A931DC51_9MICC|nr:hypothetical protein [Zhihengliuella flava]MBG6085795.1 hypothetical protein [Zhihengliuella flava]MBG6085873.1 hypothetical protein [Zhihengliuella flava]